MTSLNGTPRANRLHIGVYGRRNAGKSSLINAVCGQNAALVSDVAGTTTDPVYKAMEVYGLGPCVWIDTAGFDDVGELGRMRVEKTLDALDRTDVAILLFSAEAVRSGDFSVENEWLSRLRAKKTPVLGVLGKADTLENPTPLVDAIRSACGLEALPVSARDPGAREKMRRALLRLMPEGFNQMRLVERFVKPGDTVLLVMPQDIQAPAGRLILPQVQTIRDLLDHHTVALMVTAAEYEKGLAALKNPPDLIVTDSQVFPMVYEKKPAESRLTSFSILMAGVKGDIQAFVRGAEAVEHLTEKSRVLIAEACTHAPLAEDIGRVKIPRLLRARFGKDMPIDMVSGVDFPEDLKQYSLIVHCGACMFNRKYVLNRVEAAQAAGVPITNYGVLLAKLGGILDKIEV